MTRRQLFGMFAGLVTGLRYTPTRQTDWENYDEHLRLHKELALRKLIEHAQNYGMGIYRLDAVVQDSVVFTKLS